MKTKLIVLSILMAGLSANSQTILDTNIAGVSDTVINANDNVPSISIGTPGTGKTWSFGVLLDNGRDTALFVSPSSTPTGAAFSAANLATNKGANFIYLNNNSSKLEIIGISDGVTNAVSSNSETVITFPSVYNTSFMDTAATILKLSRAQAQPLVSITIPVTIDSVRIESRTYVNSIMDASGTLTTPFGVFSALRQNLTRTTQDKIYAKIIGTWNPTPILVQNDTAWSHQYWSNDVKAKFPLVSYDLNNASALSGSVAWITGYQPSSSIEELSIKKVNVYPNPGRDILTLDVRENIKRVLILDVTGKIVYINGVVKNKKVNVDFLQSGTYFLRIETDKFIGNSKFIKQ